MSINSMELYRTIYLLYTRTYKNIIKSIIKYMLLCLNGGFNNHCNHKYSTRVFCREYIIRLSTAAVDG